MSVFSLLEERMRITKIALALALFMTSLTFEKQILVTGHGIDSHWNASISVTNEAFAVMEKTLEAFH